MTTPNSAGSTNGVIKEDVARIIERSGSRLKPLAGSTLVVTGANGFLCSYFVEVATALNDAGLDPPCHVIAVDNLVVGLAERLAEFADRPDVELVQHDVTTPMDIKQADWIIHGASIASPPRYRQFPLETIDVNVNGTSRMLELAHSAKANGILLLSSSEVYGDPDPDHIPTSETYNGNVSATGPRACYDESKRLGETLGLSYHRQYGTPVKIVRPFNVYGPGQRLDDGRIIPDLMSAAVDRRPIVLFSDGGATRAFCYVSDAVEAMLLTLVSDAAGEVFNVGDDRDEITIGDLARRMRDVADTPPLEIRFEQSEDIDYLSDNPNRRCPDITKIREQIDWEPRIGLTEGLRRTLSSYEGAVRSNGDHS
jgi:UDP-glucuronate decarboxylase